MKLLRLFLPGFFLVLLHLSVPLFAQLSPSSQHLLDSLELDWRGNKSDTASIRELGLQVDKVVYQNPPMGLAYSRTMSEMANKINDFPGMARSQFYIGLSFRMMAQYDSALYHLERGSVIAQGHHDPDMVFQLKMQRVAVFATVGQDSEALDLVADCIRDAEAQGRYDYLYKAWSFKGSVLGGMSLTADAMQAYVRALEFGDSTEKVSRVEKASLRLNLATIFINNNNYEQANIQLDSAEVGATEKEDYNMLAFIKLRRGRVMYELGDTLTAIVKYTEGLKLAEDLQMLDLAVRASMMLTTLHYRKKWYADAYAYGLKGRDYARKVNSPGVTVTAISNMALAAAAYGRASEAKKYIQEVVQIMEDTASVLGSQDIAAGYAILSEAWEHLGNFKEAYQTLRNYTINYYENLNAENSKKLLELKEKYESEKKEKRIELLDKANKVKELELDSADIKLNRSRWIIFSVLGMSLLLLGGIWQWQNRKRLLARQESLELRQRLLRSQMNPHFIFNCLNSIQRLYVDQDFDRADDYIADFGHLMREILEISGMERIPLSRELKALELYLNLEGARLEDKFSYALEIDPELDLHNTLVPPLILQPLVENAIWHGILPSRRKGKVLIKAEWKENGVCFTVEDNGVGIETSRKNKGGGKHNSKATLILQERIGSKSRFSAEEILNAEGETAGTRAILEIKN